MARWKGLLREPLVHFLVIGAALFLWYAWTGGGSGPGSNRIVITSGLIDHLASGFERTWQRPPSEDELKGLIDDYVKEEIAYREAVGMGLDRDDTIIRRRLRQKLEFIVEDIVEAAPPTDAELQAWLDAHPDDYRVEPEIALRQVYVSTDRRGQQAAAEATRLIEVLNAAGPDAAIDQVGDPLMIPQDIQLAPKSFISRSFGEPFAERVLTLEPGRWQGPIESGYGLHVVLVKDIQPARVSTLDEVRPAVERDLLTDRRANQLNALYERLLERYRVTVEPRDAAGSEGR
jgi:parvulin-like peptidyl-prolyl isomerase